MLLERGRRTGTIQFVLFAMAFAGLLWSGSASAQGLGRISGTVTDTTGATVSGAQITATNAGTQQTVTTTSDSSGVYSFPSLAPAQYTVTAVAKGFATYAASNARLQARPGPDVDIAMKVGATTEVVTVSDRTSADRYNDRNALAGHR